MGTPNDSTDSEIIRDDTNRSQTQQQMKLQRELADKITGYAPMDEIRILLACGAKVNQSVVQGLRPLHYAVYGNNIEVVRVLLLRGSEVNALDEVGYSAMHLCAEHGNFELMQLLLKHNARVCFVDPDETELFPRAQRSEEPLRLAIKNHHFECARLLLENGADPNARYFLGPEICLIEASNVKFLRLLLMFGADANVYDRDGLTPLMRACRHRDCLESVELLVEYGAYVNAYALTRQDSRTPMHYAILSGNPKIVRLLLAHGARVNMRIDYDKPSPLDLAVLRDKVDMVEILLEANANPNAVYTYIGSPLHLASCTELHNQFAIIELLLKADGDPNLCPVYEEGQMKSPLVEYLRTQDNPDVRSIHLFLDYGGEVVMRSPLNTPTGMLRNLLRVHNRRDIFQLLLEAGQDYSIVDVERMTLPIGRRLELIEMASRPRSLMHLCRLAVRKNLRPLNPVKVAPLPLPATIKLYLLFR